LLLKNPVPFFAVSFVLSFDKLRMTKKKDAASTGARIDEINNNGNFATLQLCNFETR
jgi:hypothetical protein